MPTAPVTSGNLACFNGTTGLLQDCGSAPLSPVDCSTALTFSTGTKTFGCNTRLNVGISVVATGATGNCSSDDTAAFQSAINSAAAAGGAGVVYVPPVPPGGCYRVGALNGTNKSGLTIQGAGDASLIQVIGNDSAGNWWDLSGSSNAVFRSLKIIDNGVTVPTNLFLWMCVGTSGSCTTSGLLGGLTFDHVTIAARSNLSFLYAYGFGNIGGAGLQSNAGGGSLSITNSTWTVINNGPNFAATPYARNAPVHIDCRNSMNQASAYVTVPGQNQASICWAPLLVNAYLVDIPPAFINTGTFDNNAAMVLYNANAFSMVGGSLQCLCESPAVIWSDTQGAKFDSVLINSSDGGAQHLRHSVLIGGGINSMLSFDNVFWPVTASSAIAIDQGAGATLGGVWQLNVRNQNLGDPMVGAFVGLSANGCGPFSATQNWLVAANLQLLAGGNNIQTCGNIDANSILQQPGTISLPVGAIDNSTHVGQSSNGSWVPTDASGAGLSFTNASANWSRVGNMIFAYATLNYPSTANSANASIGGLPFAVPSAGYAQQCSLSYTTVNSAARVRAQGGNITPYNSSGGNIPNSTMSGGQVQFICIYPAS
ncbi:hypothetical protein GRB70_33020 [Bradyrhizobium neotropicale]|nr:hypothetical protein [Bradyrhizobium neotropicale]